MESSYKYALEGDIPKPCAQTAWRGQLTRSRKEEEETRGACQAHAVQAILDASFGTDRIPYYTYICMLSHVRLRGNPSDLARNVVASNWDFRTTVAYQLQTRTEYLTYQSKHETVIARPVLLGSVFLGSFI